MTIKLFGERVLVERVPMKTGAIFIPEMANDTDMHKIGRVKFVGDGVRRETLRNVIAATPVPIVVKPGDLVFFQCNTTMAAHCAYSVGKDLWLNLHQGDLIARLASNEVTLDTFEPLGKWCLVKPYVEQTGVILVPDSIVKDPTLLHWKLVKTGTTCTLPVEPDQEVLVNMGRCNLVVIERQEYGYITEDEILGVVESPTKQLALAV